MANQIFFIFILTWGNDPIWQIFFRWVETTNQILDFWKVWKAYSFWTPFSAWYILKSKALVDEVFVANDVKNQFTNGKPLVELHFGSDDWRRLQTYSTYTSSFFSWGLKWRIASPLNLDVCSIFITCLFRTRQIWGSTCSSSMRFISNWVKKSMAWVTSDLKLSGWTVVWSSSSSLLFGRLVTLVNPEDDHLGTAWVDSSGGPKGMVEWARNHKSRWWQLTYFFWFSRRKLLETEWSNLTTYFSRGLKPPTSYYWSNLTTYFFSDGLVQPPTSKVFNDLKSFFFQVP